MNYLHLNILYRNPIQQQAAIKGLLEAIVRIAPSIGPERIGAYEPVRTTFRSEDIERIAEGFDGSLLWNKSQGAVAGHVMMGIPKRHAFLGITANAGAVRAAEMKNFLCTVAGMLDVDFGYVHQLCDLEFAHTPRKTFAALDQGATTDDLRIGIPNLAWFTLFGRPYLQIFEATGPIRTDAFASCRPTASTYALQITEHASAVRSDFTSFQQLRERVIGQLGNSAFWSDDGKTPAAQVPRFDL